jgi:hypothetical protein
MIVFIFLQMTDLASVDVMCFQVGVKFLVILGSNIFTETCCCDHDDYMEDVLRLQAIMWFLLTFGTGVLHLIQINYQPDATIFQFIILTFVYSSTCFGRFPTHHQELNECSGSLCFYLRIVVTVVLCSWSGRPAQSRTTARLSPRFEV